MSILNKIDTIYIDGVFNDGSLFYEDQQTSDINIIKNNLIKLTKHLKTYQVFIRLDNGEEIKYPEYEKQYNKLNK